MIAILVFENFKKQALSCFSLFVLLVAVPTVRYEFFAKYRTNYRVSAAKFFTTKYGMETA